MSRGYHNGQMMQPNNMQQPGQIPVQMSLGTPKSNQQQGGFGMNKQMGSRGMPMQQLGNMNPNMQQQQIIPNSANANVYHSSGSLGLS